MLFLFTSKTCPNCARLKQGLKKKGVEYKEKDTETPEGLGDYYYYNSKDMSLPKLIEVDKRECFVADRTGEYDERG